MFKRLLLGLFFVTGYLALGQCPTMDISLLSQQEVDDFAANFPGCTVLTNEILVEAIDGPIDNLDGLSGIVSAQHLILKGLGITDYSGLSNLETATHLTLWSNQNTASLAGFDALQTANKLELFFNGGLTDMSGMPNLSSIGNLNIFGNSNLDNINALSFLTSLVQLTIGGNNLSSLAGLENLESVFGDVLISNELLVNLDDIGNLQNVSGSLYISSNSMLEDISALSNLQTVFNLHVVESPNLVDLSGLENIVSVSGTLRIGYNTSLVDLSIFSNLVVVGDLDIYENENLTSLNGLQNLTQIDRTFLILNNPNLTDILSLDNVSPFSVDEFAIANNAILSVCDSELVCALLASSQVVKTIQNNSVGCNSLQEVVDMCLLGVDDRNLNSQVHLAPNPTDGVFQVDLPNYLLVDEIVIHTVSGTRVGASNINTVSISHLAAGVYFVTVRTNEGSVTKRLLKK